MDDFPVVGTAGTKLTVDDLKRAFEYLSKPADPKEQLENHRQYWRDLTGKTLEEWIASGVFD